MIVLCVILSAICLVDYRHSRIPNGMIAFLLAYGIFWQALGHGAEGVFAFGRNSILILLCMYPLFRIGVLGAGDVKLFSVAGGFLSGQTAVCFLFYSLLIAAVFSIFKILRNRCGRERAFYLCAYVAQIVRTGRFELYFRDREEFKRAGICLAGPALLSILLHMGGVY